MSPSPLQGGAMPRSVAICKGPSKGFVIFPERSRGQRYSPLKSSILCVKISDNAWRLERRRQKMDSPFF
ncbi:hypothetical protein PVAP13_8NG026901 [Panicum virgatum]|uniref:Uncharacterized protein n=1 Tax=Panicum virgatum TaxID=38727 RepID=A0A8T0P4P3_PANVG|nr:hypothetical protein PVAP13_8NG026901 [Panicum virgatum]